MILALFLLDILNCSRLKIIKKFLLLLIHLCLHLNLRVKVKLFLKDLQLVFLNILQSLVIVQLHLLILNLEFRNMLVLILVVVEQRSNA